MMELPRPEPGPGDLLVRVRAAGVNPLDYKIRDGVVKVLTPYSFPLILGTDLAGDVEATGPGVTRFKVGDAIYSRLDKDRIGAIAQYALVRESAAARKPARLDYVQAASLPLVGLTSWQALVELARMQAGQKVLIHAGSGGVGTFAIQLAKHLGAQVATTAGARNHALVSRSARIWQSITGQPDSKRWQGSGRGPRHTGGRHAAALVRGGQTGRASW